MNGCRTCLRVIHPDNPLIYLSDIYLDPINPSTDTIPIKDKLADCVPELLLDTANNTVICKPCVTSLMAAYDFRHRCLQVQQEIYGNVKEMPIKNEDIGQIAMDYNNQQMVAAPQEDLLDESNTFLKPNIEENLNISTVPLNLYAATSSSRKQKPKIPEKTNPLIEFKCTICNYVCNTSIILKRHLKIHNKYYSKQCPKCELKCKSDRDIRAHLKSKHNFSEAGTTHFVNEQNTVGKNKNESKSFRKRQRIKEHKRLVAQMEPILVITPK